MIWMFFDFFTTGVFGAFLLGALFAPWEVFVAVRKYFYAYFTVGFLVLAVHQILAGRVMGAVIDAGGAGWFAWRLWNDEDFRNRRRRMVERATGFVKDMGGRLKVVPAGSR